MAERMKPNAKQNAKPAGQTVPTAEDLDPDLDARRRERIRAEAAENKRTRRNRKTSRRVMNKVSTSINMESLRKATNDSGLDRAIRHAGERYIDQLVKGGKRDLVDDKEVMRRRAHEELDGAHKAYSSMMVLQCLRPLRKGVRVDTVMESMGTAAAMWITSPQFRQQMGVYQDQMKESIEKVIQNRESRAKRKESEVVSQGGSREDLSRRMRRRLAKQERGDRCLYTPESAALAHVALAERLYESAREPDATAQYREQLKKVYDSSVSELYAMAGDDGVSAEEIETKMRMVVGERIKFHPEKAAAYNELAHGRYVPGAPRECSVAGSNTTVYQWVGDYKDCFAGDDIASGAFTVRMPQTVEEHRESLAETLAGEMNLASSPEQLDSVIISFYATSVLEDHPEALTLPMDDAEYERMQRVYAALASMEGDGLSKQERKTVFAAAFNDAVATMEQARPDLLAQWSQSSGGDFVDRAHRRYDQFTDLAEGALYEDVMEPAEAEFVDDEVEDEAAVMDPPSPRVFQAGPDVTVDLSEPAAPSARFAASAHGVRDVSERAEDVVSVEEVTDADAQTDTDTLPNVNVFADRAAASSMVEAMSGVVSDDLGRCSSAEEFSRAVGVWSDRSRCLGSYDPSLDSALSISETPHDHRPWVDDEKSNQRALEMMRMTRMMQRYNIPADAQDSLAAAAYVRGVEKLTSQQPQLLKPFEQLAVQDGQKPQHWREAQYERAVSRTRSGGLNASYADVLRLAGFDDELDVTLVDDEAETHRVREHLGEKLASPTAQGERTRRMTNRANTRYRNARISQEYNTGTRKEQEHVTPLQDPDFEMGG